MEGPRLSSRLAPQWLLALGLGINALLMGPLVAVLSSWLMSAAAAVLGQRVAWPQISFMSDYPSDVRSGYLLFVAALLFVVLLSSGLIGGLVGASPGKRVLGIRYVDAAGAPAGLRRMMRRTGLLILLLLPILVVGPVLGFVFGPIVDLLSLAALIAGLLLFWQLNVPDRHALSWVNRVAGTRPVVRTR